MIITRKGQREAMDVVRPSWVSRTGGRTGDQRTRDMAQEVVSKGRRISKGKELLKRKGEVHDLEDMEGSTENPGKIPD